MKFGNSAKFSQYWDGCGSGQEARAGTPSQDCREFGGGSDGIQGGSWRIRLFRLVISFCGDGILRAGRRTFRICRRTVETPAI